MTTIETAPDVLRIGMPCAADPPVCVACTGENCDHRCHHTCRVVDLIVTWDQVAEGDLVVDRGLLVSVAATEDDTSQSAYVRLKISVSRDPKLDRWVWRRRDHYTAVRRYIETSED